MITQKMGIFLETFIQKQLQRNVMKLGIEPKSSFKDFIKAFAKVLRVTMKFYVF